MNTPKFDNDNAFIDRNTNRNSLEYKGILHNTHDSFRNNNGTPFSIRNTVSRESYPIYR